MITHLVQDATDVAPALQSITPDAPRQHQVGVTAHEQLQVVKVTHLWILQRHDALTSSQPNPEVTYTMITLAP